MNKNDFRTRVQFMRMCLYCQYNIGTMSHGLILIRTGMVILFEFGFLCFWGTHFFLFLSFFQIGIFVRRLTEIFPGILNLGRFQKMFFLVIHPSFTNKCIIKSVLLIINVPSFRQWQVQRGMGLQDRLVQDREELVEHVWTHALQQWCRQDQEYTQQMLS